jgi:hypothetical protein
MEGFQSRSFDCGVGSQFHRGHVSSPRHVKPYVRFSLIRLSDNLLPGAFKVSCRTFLALRSV